MRVKLAGRYDTVLVAALSVAGLFLFARGIQHLLDVAHDIEGRLGIALLPALVVLTVAFVLHQTLKRQSAHADAVAHAAAAAAAEARAGELESLMAFGRSLSRALTVDALRDGLWRHLPHLVRIRDIAVWSYDGSGWEELVGGGVVSAQTIEKLAQRASASTDADRILAEEDEAGLFLPLVVGDRIVGLIVAPAAGSDAWSSDARHLLEATGPLIAIALRNVQMFRDLEKTALLDPLTGCFTRAYGTELMDVELRRAARSHSPVSVLMFDVDEFKSINDRFGHLAGDAVLAGVGRRLMHLLRRSDVRCRYGGDEFLVVLPDTPGDAAALVAEMVKREVERLEVPVGPQTVGVTISIGVAQAASDERDAARIIQRADEALYAAKAAGRNRVRAAHHEPGDEFPLDKDRRLGPVRLVASA